MADQFIVADEDRALELDAQLEETPFRDRDTLIRMYNDGLINRKNDLVSNLVEQLIGAYKGIELRTDGTITFLDMGEISADELVAKAEAYLLLLKLQRIAKEAAAEGKLSDSSQVFLGKGNTLFRAGEDGEADAPVSPEKLPKISGDAISVIGDILGIDGYSVETRFEATRLLAVRSQPVIDALAALS